MCILVYRGYLHIFLLPLWRISCNCWISTQNGEFDLNLSWQLFSSRLWNILFFWNHYLHSASSPLRAAKYAGKQKKKKGNRLKKMLHQYQLPCRSVKVGVRFDFHLKKWNRTRKTQFASFAYELRFFARGCHFMHSDSHIQVCSLKNERVAVSGSTRQTVLGDGPWYWILFTGRAGVHQHRPATPPHTLFTARSSSRHVTRARRKSAHSERESGQLLFLALRSFSRAGVK